MSDISKKLDNAESPFAFSLPLLFCPLLILGWIYGGIMLIFAPIFGYVIISIIDCLNDLGSFSKVVSTASTALFLALVIVFN